MASLSIPDHIRSFGEALRWCREQRRMTLRQLARMVGVSAPFMSYLEHDRRTTTKRTSDFAKALGVDIRELEARQGFNRDLKDWLSEHPELIGLLRDIRACHCKPLVLKQLVRDAVSDRALFAFKVTDEMGDGGSCIVFDTSYWPARRQGAQELEVEFEYTTCERYPAYDDFTGSHADLTRSLLDDGWRWECNECMKAIYGADDTGYVVDDDCRVFCSPKCHEEYRAYWEPRRAREKQGRDAAAELGLVVHDCFENVGGELIVDATLPSGRRVTSTLDWFGKELSGEH